MVFDNKGKKLAISKEELGRINTASIKDRKFVILNNKIVNMKKLYKDKKDLFKAYLEKHDVKKERKSLC